MVSRPQEVSTDSEEFLHDTVNRREPLELRLRVEGIRTSQERVRRLMREHDLQAPHRVGHAHGPKAHDGTITTEAPDVMWGTDMTTTVTVSEGAAFVFVAVDHCTTECIGLHAAKRGTRFEALEPIRQGVRERFGEIGDGVARGLRLRHDHGSNYLADDFQQEVAFFGIESSPSFVREPESNGVAERFIRTLKENLLWVSDAPTRVGIPGIPELSRVIPGTKLLIARRGGVERSRALIADSTGTVGGALLGTSPVTSYIESAAGTNAGGRTGLTAVVVAGLFLACLFLAPLAGSIPPYATAAAILYVACLMARPLVDVDWRDVTESAAAVVTVIAIPLTFSIADGLGLGVLSYVLIKVMAGRRRECSPALIAVALLFAVKFAWL